MISNACGVFVDSIRLEFIEDNSFCSKCFSPNGDQVNDLFPGIQFTNDFEMEVYDRWGSLIFKSKMFNGMEQVWRRKFCQEFMRILLEARLAKIKLNLEL